VIDGLLRFCNDNDGLSETAIEYLLLMKQQGRSETIHRALTSVAPLVQDLVNKLVLDTQE